MTAYVRFILNNRILVISIFLGITIFFGYFMSKATIRSSPEELFFGDHPGYAHYQQRCLEFGGDRFVLIGFQDKDLLLPESLARIERVVEAIESIPEVIRVVSLASVQHIDSVDDELHIDYYKDLLTEKPNLKAALLKELVSDPMTKDLLISPDGRHSVLLVEFDTDKRVMETTPDKIKTIMETFAEEGFDSKKLHQAGLIAIMAEVVHQSLLNLSQILPITVLIL
ncbi:hypothetical protein QUF76_18860, partial [Desulfobacterales bacterium HSG16]|nr:hypothetical protein [Desulfobacterales bacterium HSG16]